MQLSNQSFVKVGNILILFLLYGAALVSFVPTILGVPPAIPLYTNYVITLLLSFLIIFLGSNFHSFSINLKDIAPLTFFLGLYIFRLIDNLYLRRVYSNTFPEPITYFLYLFILNIIPCLAIGFCKDVNYDFVFRWGYRILFIVLLLSLWYNLFSGIEKTSNLRNTGNDIMGALSYGHYGVTFSIMSLVRISSRQGVKKTLYLSAYVFGIFVMYLSGSRSPLIALALCTMIYLFGSSGLLRGALLMSLIITPFVIFWKDIEVWLSGFHSGFIQRVLLSFESGDSSGRDVIYEAMWEQIKESPIFGRYFVVKSGEYVGYYPHNMILEVLGSTGIIGGIFFIIWLVKMIIKSIRFINTKDERVWIALLFLQYLLFGMSSKALYTNTNFWYFAFLLMVIFQNSYKLKNIKERKRT